nr:hypothetical protein [Phycisphaeraceae bacterium]
MSWRTWMYPELDRFPFRDQCDALLNIAEHEAMRRVNAPWPVSVAILFAVLLSLSDFLWKALNPRPPIVPTYLTFSLCAVTLIAIVWWSLRCFRREVRKRLRADLIDLGLPTCLICGLDTTGIKQSTCPECGALLDDLGDD